MRISPYELPALICWDTGSLVAVSTTNREAKEAPPVIFDLIKVRYNDVQLSLTRWHLKVSHC